MFSNIPIDIGTSFLNVSDKKSLAEIGINAK